MIKYRVTVWLGIAVGMLLAAQSWAIVPGKMPVQGVLSDSGGAALNGEFNLAFEIMDAPADGAVLWSETHDGVAIEDGFFTVYLGEIVPFPVDTFSAADELWLAMGVNGEMLSPIQLAAVPYALEANICRQVGGLEEAAIQPILNSSCVGDDYVKSIDPATGEVTCETPSVEDSFASITCSAEGDALTWNGTAWSCDDTLASTSYVDAQIAGLGTSLSDGDNATTPVGWTDLTGVPADFSDGSDANTTYSAGKGLSLTDTTFSAKGSPYSHVVVVAQSGGDFTSIQSAVNALVASGNTPGLVKIMPGTYDESVIIDRWYIHLEGSGEDLTTIRSDVGSDAPIPSFGTVTFSDTSFCSISNLSIENINSTNESVAGVKVNGGGNTINLTDVTILADAESQINAYGIVYHSLDATTIYSDLKDIEIYAREGSALNYGIFSTGDDTHVEIYDAFINAFGGATGHGLHLTANTATTTNRGEIYGSGTSEGVGVYMDDGGLYAESTLFHGGTYSIHQVNDSLGSRLELSFSKIFGAFSYDTTSTYCYGLVDTIAGLFHNSTCPTSSD